MSSKKIVNIILASILFIGELTGCATDIKESLAVESQAEIQAKNDRSTVLVVYYSATGTTAAVADSLAELMEGTTFALEPAVSYSSEELSWRDNNSRVSLEYQIQTAGM